VKNTPSNTTLSDQNYNIEKKINSKKEKEKKVQKRRQRDRDMIIKKE
jgi:hypothetical protein